MTDSHLNQNFIPMAIVGMACNFPSARNLDEYWSLLYEGRSGIVPFPEDRFDASLYYTESSGEFGKSYCKVGGIVDHRIHDENLEYITPEIREKFDLCQVTLLDVVLSAVNHAGWKPESLNGTRTGVFVGNSDSSEEPGKLMFHSHREQLSEMVNQIPSELFPEESIRKKIIAGIENNIEENYPSFWESSLIEFASNATASLVAQVLKTSGPCMALDAACASSSVALLSAQHALRSGQVDTAIVGAASLRSWCELVMLSQIQSIGSEQSRPFDASADGFIGADGYAAVIIKPLEKAIQDGDQIHGVIQSIGFSSDGRGKSFWAPRTEGQSLAIKRAYENGQDASRLQYVEAHATSTQLGDATEIQSLVSSLGDKVKNKIPVASVKANIGHSLETAGLASLIKVLLGMKNGFIPPAINIQSPNKEIDWDSVPFYPPQEPVEWPEFSDGHPRRAGVNAFGIGGLNSHLVVDQFNEQLRSKYSGQPSRSNSESEDPQEGAIAVIGMGCLMPGSESVEEYWNQLVEGRSGIQPCSEEKDLRPFTDLQGKNYGPEFQAGFLKGWEFDWKRHKIPPKQVANANPVQFMVLEAASQAMIDAGYHEKEYDQTRVGTVVGTIFSSNFAADTFLSLRLPEICEMIKSSVDQEIVSTETLNAICEEYSKILMQKIKASQDESASFNSSTTASRITKVFDLMGGAFAVDSGNASSEAAINTAMGLLNNRVNDMVICAAGNQLNDQINFEKYAKKGSLSTGEVLSPFDENFEGVVPGEGAGVVVLKRLEDAERDGDQIYGVLRTVHSVTDTADSRKAFDNTLNSYINQSQSGKKLPLELDGTAKHLKQLIQELNGTSQNAGVTVYPSNLVNQFGDLGGLSGMASLIKSLKSLQSGTLPACNGLKQVSGEINTNDSIQFLSSNTNIEDVNTFQSVICSENRNGFLGEGANVWSLLVESKDSIVMNNSILSTNKLETILVKLVVEQTGYPEEIITPGSRFDNDLHWSQESLSEFYKRLKTVLSFEEENLSLSDLFKMNSLNDVIEKLDQKDLFASSAPQESKKKETGFCHLMPVEKSLPDSSVQLAGQVPLSIVIGNDNVSESISSVSGGADFLIPLSTSFNEIQGKIQSILSGQPVHSLIYKLEQNATKESILKLVQVSKAWVELFQASYPDLTLELTIITTLGGDFGFPKREGHDQSLQDFKKLFEVLDPNSLQLRIIDFSSRDPEKLVIKMITEERARNKEDLLVGYIRGKRHVLKGVPGTEADLQEESFIQKLIQSGFVPDLLPDQQLLQQYKALSPRLEESGLIEETILRDDGSVVSHTKFSPENEPFLDGHRVEGVPLLPAVMATETMAEAAWIASNLPYINAVRNLKLINGFRMPLDRDYHAKVETRVEQNLTHCELKGDFYDKDHQFIEPHRLYQSATIEFSQHPLQFQSIPIQLPQEGDWIDIRYVDHWTRMNEGNIGTVFYGPELQTVKRVLLVENGVWADMVAPSPLGLGGERSRNCRWHFPSALFDGLMFAADMYSKHVLNSPMQLPSEVELMQFTELPQEGEKLIGWAEFLGSDKRKLFFNMFLFRPDGTLLLQCVNVTIVKL